MRYDNLLQRKELDAIRLERELLRCQIRQSQETIERSQELLRRLNDLVAEESQKQK